MKYEENVPPLISSTVAPTHYRVSMDFNITKLRIHSFTISIKVMKIKILPRIKRGVEK
jgi:hypothetical protein